MIVIRVFLLVSFLVETSHSADLLQLGAQLEERLHLNEKEPEDILNNYNLLKESFPFLESNCVRESLRIFLPLCLTSGTESVDETLRMETAVKLSLCEFKNSRLSHIPEVCINSNGDDDDDDDDMMSLMDCMLEMETSTQWWTTYSGNYQRLPSICFENSLPYEKEQILQMFLNVTDLFGNMNGYLSKQFDDIIKKSEHATDDHLKDMASIFKEYSNDILENNELSKEELRGSFQKFKRDVHSMMSDSKMELQNELEIKDQEILNKVVSFKDIINDISLELDMNNLGLIIDNFKNEHLATWDELNRYSSQAMMVHKGNQAELNNMLATTQENLQVLSQDIVDSKMDTLEIVRDINEVIKDTLIPTIKDELAPELYNVCLLYTSLYRRD